MSAGYFLWGMTQETGLLQCINLVKIKNLQLNKIIAMERKGLWQSWKKGIAGAARQEQGTEQTWAARARLVGRLQGRSKGNCKAVQFWVALALRNCGSW